MPVKPFRPTLAAFTTGLLCVVLASGTAVGATPAQSSRSGDLPSSLPQDIISTRSAVTPSQKAKIDAFVGKLSEILAKAKSQSAELLKARDLLIQSTRLAGVTPVFMRTYSEAVIKDVGPLVYGDDPLRSENALRVIAFLQTPQALGILVESLDPDRSKDASRRLVAAGLLPTATAPGAKSNLDSASLANSARNIALSVRGEEDWVVVLEELRALNQIAINPLLSEQNRSEIRTIQFETYKSIADRIAKSEKPSEMIFAIHRAMLGLRTQLINKSTATDFDSTRVAKLLEQMIAEIAKASVSHWSAINGNPRLKSGYESTLKIGTQLLSLLKSPNATSFSKLNAAFAKGPDALKSEISKLP